MALSSNIRPQDLVKQNFFSPTTDSRSSLVDALTGAVTQGRADAKTRDQNQLFAQGAQAAFSGNQTASGAAALFAANPERAKALTDSAGAFTENDRTKLAQTAFKIQSIQDPQQRNAALQEIARRVTAGGGDGSIFANLAGKPSQQQQQGLQTLIDATKTPQERTAEALSEREFGLSEQRLGLDEQRVGLQRQQTESNIRNQNSMIADRQQTQARLIQKATNAANAGVVIPAKDRRTINSDVTGLIKEAVSIRGAAASLEGLLSHGSAASRLAAVFKFMKALDPTSVVRESEQGQVYAASGAASQFVGQLNNLLGQGKLTDAGFRDLVATSKNIANSSLTSTGSSVRSYLDTYEDTLPNSFKGKLSSRVPDLFPAAKSKATTTNQNPTTSRFKIEVLN